MKKKNKLQHFEDDTEGDDAPLESSMTLHNIGKEAVAGAQEALYTWIGQMCRNQSVKIEMEFPEETWGTEPGQVIVSSIPFKVVSGDITIQATIPFREVVEIGKRRKLTCLGYVYDENPENHKK